MIKILRITFCFLIAYINTCFATEVPITLFPIDRYNQNVSHWINSTHFKNYHQNLITKKTQQRYFQNFKRRWLSPWNKQFVQPILTSHNPSVYSLEREILTKFNNTNEPSKHKYYGSNFRAHSSNWIEEIKKNINLHDLKNLTYHSNKRAILISNTEARALPTNDVGFYKFTLPGEGYPFDNLQLSSLWAGTPAYVIAKTKDGAWSMVLTPNLIAWIPSNAVATVSNRFVNRWESASKLKLAAIIRTQTPVINPVSQHFYFSAYVGSVFPLIHKNTLLIPVMSESGMARIHFAKIPPQSFATMPYAASPEHFATIIKTLVGRPYGWGGIYFYNDCSQELQTLYTPFGIWLPRHSSNQINIGQSVDVSHLSPSARIQYLMKKGHPLMSIVYINGHVFQFIGNFKKPSNPSIPMTYQNVWGLQPKNHSSRAVIGKSVFLPLLERFPENAHLDSQADKTKFKITNLDTYEPPKQKLDLASLMLP